MWKKLGIFFVLIIFMISVDTAEIVCEWSGEACTISSITPVTQPNEAITIAGKPSNYVNTATINPSLYMMRPYLGYVPTRIFYTFPNIVSFAMISSSPKTTLVTNAFVNCASLLQLYIQYVNMSNIPEGFAQSCTNLQSLILTFAGIETIDKNAFKGLVNLKKLNIDDNMITCLPTPVFQTIPNIQTLIIMNNRINAIDSSLFKNLPKLNSINIENNLISYLPTMDFTGSAIQNGRFVFKLYGNPIYAIKPDFCNTFNPRPANSTDYFDVSGIMCLPLQRMTIEKSNCQGSMAIPLQNCFSNWTMSMTAPVKCEPTCPWSSIWKQILDFLKNKL